MSIYVKKERHYVYFFDAIDLECNCLSPNFSISQATDQKNLLKDPSQPQDIARLVRHFISDAIWIREISIVVYHPSASVQFKYILRSGIVLAALWNYQWFVLNSCAVVSRNFLQKFFLELKPSMVSRIPSHGRPKAKEQTKNFNLWKNRKDSPSIRGVNNSQFAICASDLFLGCITLLRLRILSLRHLKTVSGPARLLPGIELIWTNFSAVARMLIKTEAWHGWQRSFKMLHQNHSSNIEGFVN
mgnify:CR=1 FL=1